jgi:23S rRNA pseudouridine1911/1915/1917 synthase
MPRTDWGWLVTPEELESWIVWQDETLLTVDKPAHLVCHPSKKGPWSSLIGACREYLGTDQLHPVSRLDRETSGVIVIARHQDTARRLQTAIQQRRVVKTYVAILAGELAHECIVDQPIGQDARSDFAARQWIVEGGSRSVTHYCPLAWTEGYTLAEIWPITGRQHQIRVHAAAIGHPILGDKLYGPDPSFMSRFVTEGFTPDMAAKLKLDRHALHAARIEFPDAAAGLVFSAPLPAELVAFWREAGGQLSDGFEQRVGVCGTGEI